MATANTGKGYFEDRRPAANMDPYQVCAILVETICSP
jgi:glutamine synthetase